MTLDEYRFRLVNYSIRVNQLSIAESAVLQSQNDRDFENWMNDKTFTDVFETFLHEAFKRNATGFMQKLLENLPRNYIEGTFVESPNYIGFVIEWIQDFSKNSATSGGSTLYNVIKRSNLSNCRVRDPRSEKKVLDLIIHTLSKFNMDLFEVAATEFYLTSVRGMYVIALLTGTTRHRPYSDA